MTTTDPRRLAKEFLEEIARTERTMVHAGTALVRCAILEAQAQALVEAAADLERGGGSGRRLRELAVMARDQIDLEVTRWPASTM